VAALPTMEAQASASATNEVAQPTPEPGNGMGMAIGISVGVTALVAVLIGAAVFFVLWRRKKRANTNEMPPDIIGDDFAGGNNRHLTTMTTQSEIMNRAMRAAYAAESGERESAYTANGYIDEKRFPMNNNPFGTMPRASEMIRIEGELDKIANDVERRKFVEDFSVYGYQETLSVGSTPRDTLQAPVPAWTMRSTTTNSTASSDNEPGVLSMYSMYGNLPRRDTIRTVSMLSDDVPPMPQPPSFMMPGGGAPQIDSRWSETTSDVFTRGFPSGFDAVSPLPEMPPMPQTPGRVQGGRF
jgi:hypothetical protein